MNVLICLIVISNIFHPKHYDVFVEYEDHTGYYAHSVTELNVDTESGEILIRYDEPDENGFYGVNLDLYGATITLEEAQP